MSKQTDLNREFMTTSINVKGNIYLFKIQCCCIFISIFRFNKYLPSCNVWLISLKFISHNNLEWIQTSLDFKWFKCMIMVKPYTVWLDRLCWIKGASCMNFDVRWICILDTWHNTKLWKKKEARHGHIFTCMRLSINI